MRESLVILGCSQRKRRTSRLLPAIERYDGPLFRVLRRYMAQCPDRAPAVRVLSARFGLIPGESEIPRYDRLIDATELLKLHDQVARQTAGAIKACSPKRIFVSAGARYWPLLSAPLKQHGVSASLTVARGGIGGRASRLRHWLESVATRTVGRKPPAFAGEATLLGTTVRKTTAEILDIARRVLADDPAGARRFETWYVPVGCERVAPKWLVSLLFDKPVARFRTAEANRVLQQLGLPALHACRSRDVLLEHVDG